MAKYRIMYRPLHKMVDTIVTVEATTMNAMLAMLPRKASKELVQHLYIHEFDDKGNIKEVVSYEKKTDEATGKPAKPKLKLVTTPARYILSDKCVRQGHYTAYEVTSA